MKEKEFISNMKEYISSIVKKAAVNKCKFNIGKLII